MTLLAQAAAVAAKDLRIEVRSHRIAGAVLPLGATLMIGFAVLTGPDGDQLAAAAPGLAWLTLLFSAMFAIQRGYDAENEDNALEGLLLAPARRSAIYLGKTAALFAELLILEAVLLGLAGLAVGWPDPPGWAMLALVCVLGTAGLSATGSLFGLMTEAAHAKGTALPLLMLPVAMPVLYFAVKAAEPGHAVVWLVALVVTDVVIVTVGALAAQHVVED
jgi:heme exporter protein CcmB